MSELSEKKRRKNDALLTLLLTLVAVALLAIYFLHGRAPAKRVEISIGHSLEAAFSFGEEKSWEWHEGGNYVTVASDHSGVRIVSSSCPDQLCVKQGTIAEAGQSVVCLPNRVVVHLGADREAELDAVLH